MELRKIEITTDTTIYVGYYGVHDCLKQGMAMEEFLGVLTDRKGKPLILKMKRCPVCGKVYLRGDKYQRLWCPLKNYSFHDRCGERRFLVSVGGRYDWGIGYVGNWSFYFPAGIDAEEEVVYEV